MKEQFIQKARQKHGDKYNYDKVDYKNSRTKIIISCPIHGEFLQTPSAHLTGCGCPKCGRKKAHSKSRKNEKQTRWTTETFIQKSKEIHGDFYDYSEVNYEKTDSKVVIKCPEHGRFLQTPHKHLLGHGCPLCGKEKMGRIHKEQCLKSKTYGRDALREYVDTPTFIRKAKTIHGDKYDYSRVDYKNKYSKVTIGCREHGFFEQIASNHLSGNGCPQCSKHKFGIKDTKEIFIEKATKKHGNKYDYSKVNYVQSKEKVEIICLKHGSFWQTPHDHLLGCGCPKCKRPESRLEEKMRGFIANYSFQSQKRFDWLGLQSLDFFLPEYNIGIECQGEQHFRPVSVFGGEEKYKQVLERDYRKRSICKQHGIKILYYSDVKNIPDEFLKEYEISTSKDDFLHILEKETKKGRPSMKEVDIESLILESIFSGIKIGKQL